MKNHNHFPNFSKITIDDKAWYDSLVRKYPPYADFSFGNLIIWLDQRDDLELSILGDALVLKFTNFFMNDAKTITFIGDSDIEKVCTGIFDYQHRLGLPAEIAIAPDIVADKLSSSSQFSVVEDDENHEYLYKTTAWSGMIDSTMRKLRREVRTYEKDFGSRTKLVSLDLSQQSSILELHSSLQSWENTFSLNDADKHEAQVIATTFRLAHRLGYDNLCLFVDDKMEGFALCQPTAQGNTIILNHVKTSYKYRYMFDYLLHSLAVHLKSKGIYYINFEQDLGIAGLRTHKQSLKPYKLLKKYTITPR